MTGFKLNKKYFAKYLKKNVLLIASVAVCGVVLFLSSAESQSNVLNQTADVNQPQNDQNKLTSNFFSDNTDFTGSSALNGKELFYKTMLALLLVGALGTAAIFMTKKFLPRIANLQGKEIKVVETVHIGPRRSVLLLEIGKRRI